MVDPETRLGRALGDRYAIDRELGHGGMATVYLAQDLRHGRPVALKVLAPGLAAVVGADRFLAEIRVTARLNHPHILPLHDSGEADGLLFYTMPVVAGESLRRRLDRDGPLPVDEAVRVAEQVAAALEYAHRQGVVHRDVKPENILLHEGEAMVTDFGIALAVAAAGGPRLTQTGLVLGTPAYMSPEQVAGDCDADARSDVYAPACVLYEMLAGQPPFTGPTVQAVLARHVTDPVPPLTTLRAGVPPAVVVALTTALAKAPVDRFPSAKAFADALRAQAAAPEPKSIVVLPFDNLSPDPEQAYFADGLTEEVISDLARVRALRVISRTSAMKLKGTQKDLPTIARELGVRYVLEGSVRRAGTALRITAQLIDATTDTHLWAAKYRGSLDDVFKIQEEVSRSIVGALEVELTPRESQRLERRPANDVRVYELSLRARRDLQSFTEPGIRRAIRDLQSGLEMFGDDAALFYLLGDAYLYCREFGLDVEDGAVLRAQECAGSVMRLEPDSWRGHYLLGRIERFSGSVLKGLRHFERAYAVEPDSPELLFWLAQGYKQHAGQQAVAMRMIRKLVSIEPLSPPAYLLLAFAHWFNGDLDRATRGFTRVSEMEPDNCLSDMWLTFVLLWRGQTRQALEHIDRVTRHRQADSISVWTSEFLQFTRFAIERQPDRASAALSAGSRAYLWNDPDLPWQVAGICAFMDQRDEAFRWLRRAVDRGCINYPLLAERDPLFASLRGDERFRELMDRIRRPWEQFEIGIDVSRLPRASDD